MVNAECDHINNIIHDNALTNLRWLSGKDNMMRRQNYNMPSDETLHQIAKDLLKNKLTVLQIADKYQLSYKCVLGYLKKRTSERCAISV